MNFAQPAASLLVAKARGDVPHEGGARVARGSPSDRILVRWIEQGCPQGDQKDLPPPKEFAEGWRIGKPDLVFTCAEISRICPRVTARKSTPDR